MLESTKESNPRQFQFYINEGECPQISPGIKYQGKNDQIIFNIDNGQKSKIN